MSSRHRFRNQKTPIELTSNKSLTLALRSRSGAGDVDRCCCCSDSRLSGEPRTTVESSLAKPGVAGSNAFWVLAMVSQSGRETLFVAQLFTFAAGEQPNNETSRRIWQARTSVTKQRRTISTVRTTTIRSSSCHSTSALSQHMARSP